jgi:hypothetical protein
MFLEFSKLPFWGFFESPTVRPFIPSCSHVGEVSPSSQTCRYRGYEISTSPTESTILVVDKSGKMVDLRRSHKSNLNFYR